MASAQEYRKMSEKDLNTELLNLRREQFNLRMQLGSGNTPKIHRSVQCVMISRVLKPC